LLEHSAKVDVIEITVVGARLEAALRELDYGRLTFEHERVDGDLLNGCSSKVDWCVLERVNDSEAESIPFLTLHISLQERQVLVVVGVDDKFPILDINNLEVGSCAHKQDDTVPGAVLGKFERDGELVLLTLGEEWARDLEGVGAVKVCYVARDGIPPDQSK